MSSIELKSEHARQGDGHGVPRRVASDRDNIKSRIRVAPLLITLGAVAVAAVLAWTTWQTYMGAPWTRDGTVRAYVVTMAPGVAGRIIKLPVADNQFVHHPDYLSDAVEKIAMREPASERKAHVSGAVIPLRRNNS